MPIMIKFNLFHWTVWTTVVLVMWSWIGMEWNGLSFSSKFGFGSYNVSFVKTVPKKIGVLIRSVKFISSEVALYIYISRIRLCMKYCCYVWDVTWICGESFRNGCVGLLVLPCCFFWILGLLPKCGHTKPFLYELLS